MYKEQILKDLQAIIDECSWRGAVQSFIIIEMVEKVIKQIKPAPIIETVVEEIEETKELTKEDLVNLYKEKFQKKPFAGWSEEILKEKLGI